MERFFDLRPSPPPPQAWAQAEPLLTCHQTFLGHDLPGQLVALQALARLLSAEDLPAETGELLGRIAALTRRLDALVRRVAELGRVGREPPWGPPLALADLVAEAVAEVRCSGRALECAVSGDAIRLTVSRRLCHAVLVQLLRNAAQAALTGQAAAVEVRGEKEPTAFSGWPLALSVSDRGKGLTADQASRLFVPLVPPNPGGRRDDSAEGAGLGLFLVRLIVAHWEGAIHVRSESGQGTTVTLLLPRAALPA